MDSYCSIPPWILSVPPHSRPDSQVPLVSPSLLVPCLTCGHPSRAVFSRLTASQVQAPQPRPKTALPTQLVTDSRVPARAVFPFQDSVHEFSLPGKMPPTLTSPGKMPLLSKWHHFPPSGLFIQAQNVALPTLSWMDCVGGVPTVAAGGRGALSREGVACVCSSR